MANLIILDSERRDFPASNRLLSELYKRLGDKYLKIIYRFFIIPKLKRYTKQGFKVIALDKETELFLARKNILFSAISRYTSEPDFRRSEKNAVDFIRNIQNLFPELDAKYMGISLWEANELTVYESFLKPIITYIELIKKIIEAEKPSRLIILNSSSKAGMIQKMLSGIGGKKIKKEDKTDIISKTKKTMLRAFMPLAVRRIHSEFVEKLKYPKSANSARHSPEESGDITFFGTERGFYYSLPFLKKIREEAVILQDGVYSRKKEGFHYDVAENYCSQPSGERLFEFRRGLSSSLSRLKKSSRFRLGFQYNGVPLFQILEDMFDYLFNAGYLTSAFYCECFNNYLLRNKPRLIVVMGEEARKYKILLSLSKKCGEKYQAKSLYLMHGSFGRNYLLSSLISDKIAVYGEHYKQILSSLGNRKENIIAAGNPLWDYLAKKRFSRKKLISELGLPKDKKIILLMSVTFPMEARTRLAHPVIEAISTLPSCHLVIKLHPEEKPDFYKELLKKYNLKATIVSRISLLHPLISLSELVIISNSTTGLEALLLHKPLIDVNIGKMPYYQDYVKEKVALGVRKEEELLPAIKSILYSKKIRKELTRNRDKYILEHAYRQDGKAAERVVRLIRGMVGEKDGDTGI